MKKILIILLAAISLSMSERTEPSKYLSLIANTKAGLLKGDWRITGNINNSARRTTYREIEIEFLFLDSKENIIAKKDLIFCNEKSFEGLKPKNNYKFNYVISGPIESKSITWQIIGASCQ